MADEFICQPYERTDGVYTFRDAICLTQAQWDVITPEEVTAMQDQRWQDWLTVITSPPFNLPPVDPPIDPPPEG